MAVKIVLIFFLLFTLQLAHTVSAQFGFFEQFFDGQQGGGGGGGGAGAGAGGQAGGGGDQHSSKDAPQTEDQLRQASAAAAQKCKQYVCAVSFACVASPKDCACVKPNERKCRTKDWYICIRKDQQCSDFDL